MARLAAFQSARCDAFGGRLSKPLLTVRGYDLPSWLTADWAVLCSSYSGETEETLACFAAAETLGARRIVVSTGGALVKAARSAGDPVIGLPGLLPAPRTAVAYMLVCTAEVASAVGVAPRIADELESAATFLEEHRAGLEHTAAEIAAQLSGAVPVVYGAGVTAAAARRWKTQLNENAKLAAFYSELPEANHNELCGWKGGEAGDGSFAAVLLGLVAVIAALIVWIELMIRSVLVYILVALSPFSFGWNLAKASGPMR